MVSGSPTDSADGAMAASSRVFSFAEAGAPIFPGQFAMTAALEGASSICTDGGSRAIAMVSGSPTDSADGATGLWSPGAIVAGSGFAVLVATGTADFGISPGVNWPLSHPSSRDANCPLAGALPARIAVAVCAGAAASWRGAVTMHANGCRSASKGCAIGEAGLSSCKWKELK